MTDHTQPDEDNAIMARLRELSQADGQEATAEGVTRDQQAWELNVANGSAAAAQSWAESRLYDARAKAWEAFATVLTMLAILGFINTLVLLTLHVIQAFQ